MATKRTPKKSKAPKRVYNLEGLRRGFLDDPDNWQKYWDEWILFEDDPNTQHWTAWVRYPSELRMSIPIAALQSIGTDPTIASRLYIRVAINILSSHPLLPVWMDAGDQEFMNIVHQFTARALTMNLNAVPKLHSHAKSIIRETLEPIGYSFGDYVDLEELINICWNGNGMLVAQASDRICEECDLRHEDKVGHVYGYLMVDR